MKKVTSSSKQLENEVLLNHFRLEGWCKETSPAKAYLAKKIPKCNKNLLLALAKVVSFYLHIPLDREAQRNKTILIKWFDEHFIEATQFIDAKVCILDHDYKEIGDQPTYILDKFNQQSRDEY